MEVVSFLLLLLLNQESDLHYLHGSSEKNDNSLSDLFLDCLLSLIRSTKPQHIRFIAFYCTKKQQILILDRLNPDYGVIAP